MGGARDGRGSRWEGLEMGGARDGRGSRWEGLEMGGARDGRGETGGVGIAIVAYQKLKQNVTSSDYI